MIPSPSIFAAWNAEYRGSVNFLAMSSFAGTVAGSLTTDLHYRVSPDGKRWFKVGAGGDLAEYQAINVNGGFQARRMVMFKGRAFAVGRVFESGGATKSAIFASGDGFEFERKPTPADSAVNGVFVDVAASASMICALAEDGRVVYSSDGDTWKITATIVAAPATCIAQGNGFWAVGGANGQIAGTGNPAGAWNARASGLGSLPIRRIIAGNVFAAFASVGISTGAFAATGSFTQRYAGAVSVIWAGYGGGRWLGGTVSNEFLMSADGGMSWAVAANANNPSIGSQIESGLYEAGEWRLFRVDGQIATSLDGLNWTLLSGTGLYPSVRYSAVCATGWN